MQGFMLDKNWPPLDRNLGFVINRTAYLMRRFLTGQFRGKGHSITPEEWVLLLRLWNENGLTQGELADSAIRDRTTITRILDGLVRKGLVRRKTDPDDRRRVCACLTKKGQSLQKRLLPIALKLKDRVIDGISRKQIETTLKTLYRLQANISEESEIPVTTKQTSGRKLRSRKRS